MVGPGQGCLEGLRKPVGWLGELGYTADQQEVKPCPD